MMTRDYDLPVEAVREAIHYCMRNAALVRREREEDWAVSQARGLVAPPAVASDVAPSHDWFERPAAAIRESC